MIGSIELHVTPAEWADIQEQLATYRKSNDRDEAGQLRSDQARTVDAVGVVLGAQVGDELRLMVARLDHVVLVHELNVLVRFTRVIT